MTKPDDSSLSEQEFQNVCEHADLLLREASAYGVFPTPIADIMSAAKLSIVDDVLLDDDLLKNFFKKAKAGIATLKSALSKVFGLFEPNDRLVVIDRELPNIRKSFVKLHEAGHAYLPHQNGIYALIHDCEQTLDPDTTDLFEREANVFASEVFFQRNQFKIEADDHDFSIKVPMRLAKKYGASNYAAMRRYVAAHSNACCLVVLEMPTLTLSGFKADTRRVVASHQFAKIYDSLSLFNGIDERHLLGHIVPIGRRMTGRRKITVTDRNGDLRICAAEAFNSTHQILILICDNGLVAGPSIFVPENYRVDATP